MFESLLPDTVSAVDPQAEWKRQQERRRKAERAALDGVDGLLDPAQRETSGKIWAELPDGGAASKSRLANSVWLAGQLNRDAGEVSENYDYWRAIYARAEFDGEGMGDDAAFTARVKQVAQKGRSVRWLVDGAGPDEITDKAEREKVNAVAARVWAERAGLAGKPLADGYAAWQAAAKASPHWEAGADTDILPEFERAYNAATDAVAPHREKLDAAFQALAGAYRRGLGEDATGSTEKAIAWLDSMSLDEFRRVGVPALQALAAEQPPEKRAGFMGWVANIADAGGDRLGAAAPALSDTAYLAGRAVMEPVARAVKNPEELADYEQRRTREKERAAIAAMIRTLGSSTIDPQQLLSSGTIGRTVEQASYDVAGSVGAMATMAVPILGIPASLATYAAENKADMLLSNPKISLDAASSAAMLAAPVQSALDFLSLKLVAGRLPGLSSIVQKLGAPGGNAAAKVATYALGSAAVEYTAEQLQDAAPLAAQDVLAKLASDVPGADWSGFELMNWRTLWAVLPLSLIGAGVNAARNRQASRALVSDAPALAAVGFDENQIASIQSAPNPVASLAAQWGDRGEITAATVQAFESRVLENEQAGARTMEELEKAGVTITGSGDKFTVTDTKTGTATTHASRASAYTAAFGHMEKQDAPLLDMLQALDAGAMSFTAEIGGNRESVAEYNLSRDAVANDPDATPEARAVAGRDQSAMAERMKIYEAEHGDNVDWNAISVGGQSGYEVREGLKQAVIRVTKGEKPSTVLEEWTEAAYSRMTSEGKVTQDQIMKALVEVEALTGDTYLHGYTGGKNAEQDALAIKEAFSSLAIVHVTGKGRAGKPGEKAAGVLRESRMAERRRLREVLATGKVASWIVDALRTAQEFTRVLVGKAVRLNRARRENGALEIDQWLDEATGLSADVQHAREVVKEAGKMFDNAAPVAFAKQAEAAPDVGFSLNEDGYQMQHRPRDDGPRGHDLLEGDVSPRDIYQHPEWYAGDADSPEFKESIKAIRAIKGKPKALVTIYRAAPKGAEFKSGDWISLSKTYAKNHAMVDDNPENDMPVISAKVPASHIKWAGDDLNEFGYYPETAESQPGFSLSASDAEYMAAVQAGDMETAQRMVDEAAKAAGYTDRLWHGTRAANRKRLEFYVFDMPEGRFQLGVHFGTEQAAREIKPKPKGVFQFWIKPGNTIEMPDLGKWDYQAVMMELRRSGISITEDEYTGVWNQFDNAKALRELLRSKGIDSIRYVNEVEAAGSTSMIVLDVNQIKSADPVTRDEAGNIIPLSQRFNPASDSISYRLTPSATLDALAEQMAGKTRDPEARRKIYEAATGALERLKIRWTEYKPKVEQRTDKELDKEQAFREAAAYADAEEAIFDTLTPAARDALGYTPDDTSAFAGPLAQLFSGGRFGTRGRIRGQAKAQEIAAREGYPMGGEYNGAEGIPALFFGGEIAPDQAAQEAFEAGLIAEADTDLLWSAMRSEMTTQANNRDAAAAAMESLKEARKAARNKAKEEAYEWRKEQDEMQAKDWDGRAVLLRHLRTLDAILSAVPPELRAKVGGWTKLATLKTQPAMAKELGRRIEKLDENLESYLKKEALANIQKLLKKASPDREAGEKPRGKLGAEVHRFFDGVNAVIDLEESDLEARRLALAGEYGNKDLTDAQAADIFERELILDTFGALGNPEGHNAAHLTRALDMLEQVYQEGRNRWKAMEEMRLAEVAGFAGDLVNTWGAGSEAGLQAQAAQADKLRTRLKNGLTWDMYSGSQIFEDLLGEKHPLAIRWNRALREGTNATIDDQRALNRRWKDAMKTAFGGYGLKARKALWKMATAQTMEMEVTPTGTKETVIPIESIPSLKALGYSKADIAAAEAAFEALSDKSMAQNVTISSEVEGVTEIVNYTEAQAIAITMLADQAQYANNLKRVGWTPSAVAQLEAMLSDSGKALREFMRAEYRDGYTPLNNVFERMFGVALPQIKGYSPANFWHMGQDKATGPEGDVQNTGFRATALKTRTKHKAEPRAKNAFALFFGHAAQMSHWRNNAEFARELRGVFGNPAVKKALISKYGEGAMRAVTQRIESIEGNGIMQAYGEMDSIFGMVAKWKAYGALAWNVGTALVQATAATAVAIKMSPAAYMRGLGKLATGRGWGTVLRMMKSETIQRRMESTWGREVTDALGQTTAAASMLQGPGPWIELAHKGMDAIGSVDALFTSIGAAVHFDYAEQQALKQGFTADEALKHAEQETSQIIFETAQPQSASQKSNFELRNAGLAKTGYLFMSDARKNTAHFLKLMMGANDQNRGKALLVWPVLGLLTQAIRNVWQDARDDDDDELFDSENWTGKEFLFAALMGPVNGIPVLGETLNKIATGYGSSGVTDNTVRAIAKIKDLMETTKAEERDKEKIETTTRDVLTILKGLNTSLSVAANVGEQAFRVGDNLWDDEEETAAKAKKKKPSE